MFYQGDALKTVAKLEYGTYHAVITSPPYYNRFDYGHPAQTGYGQSREEYLTYNRCLVNELFRVTVPGGAMFVNVGNLWNNYGTVKSLGDKQRPDKHDSNKPRTPLMAYYREKAMLELSGDWQALGYLEGWILRDIYIWVKPGSSSSNSDRSANSYEQVLYFRKPDKPTGRYKEAYWDGKYLPRNVLEYKPESNPSHPCPLPRQMYADFIRATVPMDGYCLDPYGGTGSIADVAATFDRKADYIDLVDYRQGESPSD